MATKKTEKVASRTATTRRGRKSEGGSPNKQAAGAHPAVDVSAVQATEEWQRTFDTVPDPIAILDPQYRIVRVNKAMAERLGLAKDRCVGETCYRLVHGSDKPPSFCPHAGLLQDGEEHTVEVHEDRLAGDFLVTVSPLRDSAGCLVGSVHLARDITRRTQAERALGEANQHLDFLCNHANAPIIVWDARFNIIRFNHAVESLTGRRANEVVGGSLEVLFPPALVKSSLERIADTLQGECGEGIEIRMLHVDGSERTVLWNFATVCGPDGQTPMSTVAQGQVSPLTQERLVPQRDDAGQISSLQLISFKLGNETYGIEITKIREILLVGEITHVPETLPYVKGLINLRGTVVPVIDLRVRFSLADTELTPESRIMVVHVASRTIGIVVDSVNQVLRVTRQEILPAPLTVTNSGNEYMTGLVRLKEGLLIVLDVDRLFGDEESSGLAEVAVDTL